MCRCYDQETVHLLLQTVWHGWSLVQLLYSQQASWKDAPPIIFQAHDTPSQLFSSCLPYTPSLCLTSQGRDCIRNHELLAYPFLKIYFDNSKTKDYCLILRLIMIGHVIKCKCFRKLKDEELTFYKSIASSMMQIFRN